MAWKVVDRRLGKAEPPKQRNKRQREWDAKYGEGAWEVGYVVDGRVHRSGRGYRGHLLPQLRTTFPAPPG